MNIHVKRVAGQWACVAAALFCMQTANAQQIMSSSFDSGATSIPAGLCAWNASGPTVSGSLVTGWEDNSCWKDASGATIAYALDTSTRYTGAASLSIKSTNVTPQLTAPFTMKSGKTYSATVYLRASKSQEVVVQLRLSGPPYTAYGVASKTIGIFWTPVTVTADAPLTASNVAAGLFILPKTPGNIWLDSASITESTATNAITRTGHSVTRSFFGTHTHRDLRWPDLGNALGADRMWDGEGIQMRDIFPTSDLSKANWTKFEARIARAQQNGADLIMTLGGNIPKWASSDPTGQEVSCSLYTTKHDANGKPIPGTGIGEGAPPVSRTVWKDMVSAVVKKANGRIKYWEIWNEPYVCAMFNVRRPTDYTKYLVDLSYDAYKIIKTNDKSLTVLSPTLYTYKLDFVDEFLGLGGGRYADVIAIHAYDEYINQHLVGSGGSGAPNGPEMLFIKEHGVLNLKHILARHNLSTKPIWNTESGYLASSTPGGQPDDAKGAPYVARHLLLSSLAGLDRSYYYSWDLRGKVVALGRELDGEGSNNYTKTAAGVAFETMAKWLTGTTIKAVSTPAADGQPWVVTLLRATTGTTELIVWNPAGNDMAYTVPTGLAFSASLSGGKTGVSAGTATTINGWPQLLTSY